jgi:hypothetical protein
MAPNAENDFDSFAFTIPSGAVLLSGRVDLSDFENDYNYSDWFLFAGTADWNTGTKLGLYTAFSPGSATFAAPLGPGVYNVSHVTQSANYPTPSTADYVFAFTLVPEPALAGILVPGVVIVIAVARLTRLAC